MLAAGTWIIRGTLFLPNGGIIQNFGGIQEVLFLEVALTESWVICTFMLPHDFHWLIHFMLRSHHSSCSRAGHAQCHAFLAARRSRLRCGHSVSRTIGTFLLRLKLGIRASLFTIFGWISGPRVDQGTNRSGGHTSIVTVVKIWLYSFGVVVIILLVCACSSFPHSSQAHP